LSGHIYLWLARKSEVLTDIPQMTSKFGKLYYQSTAKETVSILQPSDGLDLVNPLRLEGHLANFPAIQTHRSCRFHLAADVPGLRRSGSSSQIINQPHDFSEQYPRHRPSANWNVT